MPVYKNMTKEYKLRAGRIVIAKTNGDVYHIIFEMGVRILKRAFYTVSLVDVYSRPERDRQCGQRITGQLAAPVRVLHWIWILRFRDGGLFMRRYQVSFCSE